ncbi:hypothetical protein AJ80_08236 [Polytolypa hystricis UAMH7299]|uniref:PARP-type domain-containing protein n=1 Tax=Polytolypa hystricis (strain UAMH7299) TaxID=1447883 RepID=A0A2B7XBQ1_POLH7|nr:hypothetical protein AJ80_08236 [Polytolypa hystricis UAMH7299]
MPIYRVGQTFLKTNFLRIIEEASTGRAGCKNKECQDNKDKIGKGELRFGTWVESERFQSWTWKHWGCVTPRQIAGLNDTVDGDCTDIDGYDEISPEHQEKIREAVEQGHVADSDWKGDVEVNRPGKVGFRVRVSKKQKQKEEEEEEEQEEKEEDTKAKATKPKKRRRSKKEAEEEKEEEEEEEEEEEAEPVSKKAKTTEKRRKSKVAEEVVASDDEEAEKPAKATKAAAKAQTKSKDDMVSPRAARGRGRKARAEAVQDNGEEDDKPVLRRSSRKAAEAGGKPRIRKRSG